MAILGAATRSFNPVWYFVDNNGKQFDDTFYMWVLQNQIPYAPATVWHDPAMNIPWTSPIQFLANGTLPTEIYWDPTQTYRLEFRQNTILPPTQADQLIYLIENYSPSESGGGTNPTSASIYTDNQITNPQFAALNIPTTYTATAVTNPASLNFAPGWFLEGLTGTGNITLTQTPLTSTSPNPGNAPFALHIQLSGFTGSPYIRQRFQQNGVNWANLFVSGSLTAMSGMPVNISTRVDNSAGAPIMSIIQPTLTSSIWTEYKGVSQFPASTNTNIPPNAWLDYKIFIPNNTDVYLTNIQIIASNTMNEYEYQQTTINRQLDQTFNYYQPLLNYKNTPSFLVGWDFPLNPAQINGNSVAVQAVGANQAFYAWDQTIVYQTANSGVSVSRASASGALVLTAAQIGQVALIQYLDKPTAQKVLQDRMSVNIQASTTAVAGSLAGKVTLWACTDANLTHLPNTLVTALDATGFPTVGNGAWTQVPNIFQHNQFTLLPASSALDEGSDIQLFGWNLQGGTPATTANFFAIVIGFAAWAVNDAITFNSISLCPGHIPTRPAPKTASETLLDCQRYFYSTFPPATKPVQAFGVNTGAIEFIVASGTRGAFIGAAYPTTMRTNPTQTTFNPVNANAQIWDIDAAGGADCSATASSPNATSKNYALQATPPGSAAAGDRLQVYLTSDARLGVVD